MLRSGVDHLKFGETVGDISHRENLQFALQAKKGYHFSDSSPFCILLLWHSVSTLSVCLLIATFIQPKRVVLAGCTLCFLAWLDNF